MKFTATSAPCLWEPWGFVQALGKEPCSFFWDQLFNLAICYQFALISAVLRNPARVLLTFCWNPSPCKENLRTAPLSQADHFW